MERQMKWYEVCKVISLVLAVLAAVGTAVMAAVLLNTLSVGKYVMSIRIAEGMQGIIALGSVVYAVAAVMLFVTYFALKNYRKTALYMMYAFNIGVPAVILASIPIGLSYADTFIMNMLMAGNIDIYQADAISTAISFAVTAISILNALICGGCLIPNTIYFKKRRDLLK